MNALWPGVAAGSLVNDTWLSEAMARPCYRLHLEPTAADGATIPIDPSEPLLIDARAPG